LAVGAIVGDGEGAVLRAAGGGELEVRGGDALPAFAAAAKYVLISPLAATRIFAFETRDRGAAPLEVPC
jgi:hypothetical protein